MSKSINDIRMFNWHKMVSSTRFDVNKIEYHKKVYVTFYITESQSFAF